MSGPINVALLRSAPPELQAGAMALSIFAIHALGDLWSPSLIGLAADHAPMQTAMMRLPDCVRARRAHLVGNLAAKARRRIRAVDLNLARELRANAILR